MTEFDPRPEPCRLCALAVVAFSLALDALFIWAVVTIIRWSI